MPTKPASILTPARVKALRELSDVLAAYREGFRLGSTGQEFPARRKQPHTPLQRRALRSGYDDGRIAYAQALAQVIVSTKSPVPA